jgi:hypothetical protein
MLYKTKGRAAVPYQVKGTDTSGSVSLRRESVAASLKKAAELINDGCWDVEITMPDGKIYGSTEFDQLRTEISAA